MEREARDMFDLSQRAIDLVWSELAASPLTPSARPVDRLPDVGPRNAARRSALGRDVLALIDQIDPSRLPFDQGVTLEVARWMAERWSYEEAWYWLLFDPTGKGFFSIFGPTAYCGGYLLGLVGAIFKGFAFEAPGDGDRYLGLVRDYARLVGQLHARTQGQADRGIFLPEPQRQQSLPLLRKLREDSSSLLTPHPARLANGPFADIATRVAAAITREVLPAFDRFSALLESPAYAQSCGPNVGLGQYPGGPEAYAALVRIHTTLDLTAEQIHTIGERRIAEIRLEMRALLDQIGFTGSITDYIAKVAADPAWRAEGDEAVNAVFSGYIDRIQPHLEDHFTFRPQAGYGVAPLPAALASAMTYGYYAAPTPSQPKGLYVYNGANLSKKPTMGIGPLTYHELAPGHHFHFSIQRESQTLHPLRQNIFFNAFNEAWAEYSATFAGEIGLYPAPEERFGRLMSDAFLTCRLVVDTGLNLFGWTLEQGRAYMQHNGFLPETEAAAETLRYACDLPAQALAYKLGDRFLFDEREEMRAALGEAFHVRLFHDAVLRAGALPFPVLATHLRAETARLSALAR